ncbi:MAG: hypothetical protein GX663_08455 [Clostridiales bacterium]|nr:hypothetical protein [Clostridiales bacterium]
MKNNWTALDHAAKIFVAGTEKTETQVFRFSCELRQDVKRALLQSALESTLELFPSYRVVLKKGFFWYYLEESDIKTTVEPETRRVCGDMRCTRTKKLLFEVTYFNKRVNLEVYHVLSDGTSAILFFKTLISKYISLAEDLPMPKTTIDASLSQRKDDSYDKYYSGEKIKRSEPSPACRLQGFKYSENFLRNITGRLPSYKIYMLAKKYDVTVTVLICAFVIRAIGENVTARERKKPIVLSVPVNLRSYFPSASARNFFGAMYVSYHWKTGSGNLEDIIASVQRQFNESLNADFLSRQMDEQSQAEHNIFAKMAPLFLKTFILRIIYKRNLRGITATVSNVGKIKLDPELEPYVKAFDVCASTCKFQASICTFDNLLSVSCTNPHISSDIEKAFFRMLTDEEIEVDISSNAMEEKM